MSHLLKAHIYVMHKNIHNISRKTPSVRTYLCSADKNPHPDAQAAFDALQDAYSTLAAADLRSQYDMDLARARKGRRLSIRRMRKLLKEWYEREGVCVCIYVCMYVCVLLTLPCVRGQVGESMQQLQPVATGDGSGGRRSQLGQAAGHPDTLGGRSGPHHLHASIHMLRCDVWWRSGEWVAGTRKMREEWLGHMLLLPSAADRWVMVDGVVGGHG